MTYREARTPVPGVVAWAHGGDPCGTRILPDGCLDLVWDGATLRVAGPDSTARHHPGRGAVAGLRLGLGLGPAALGIPADAVRDRTVDLDAVWSPRRARELADRVGTASAPARALATWAGSVLAADPGEPFGPRVFAAAAAGTTVAAIADRLGTTPRTLHRRCLPVFGYGPQHLRRVLRLQRALAAARGGRGWADVAALTGYADQAHLARDARALTGSTPTGLLER